MAPRVLMLVAGSITHDARVQRSACSLATHGHDVTVVCGAPPASPEQDGYRIVHTPIVVSEKATRKLRSAFVSDHRRAAKRLDQPYREAWTELIRREAPDVVHVHDYHGLGAAVDAAGPQVRVVYDAHEHTAAKISGSGAQKAVALYLRQNVPMVDAVVTVGKALGNVLTRELRLALRPVVIHNAPSLHHRRPAPYDLRTAAGVGPSTPLIVYSGSQSKRRSLDTPIRALASLPGVHLVFVFAVDKITAQLAKVAEEYAVRDRVHFLPPVAPDAVVSLLRGADVAVNPLRPHRNGDVAMPNKLFEYLHAGVPVVVSDSRAMAQFVRKYLLGEVVPGERPEAWARAIERVLADPGAYAGDPEERAELRREWSWEAQERRLLELYERMLATTEDAWYDRVYASSVKYQAPYDESVYYPGWRIVADRLQAIGALSVLDIGCGPGQFAALLRDTGIASYLGIDFSREAIRRARKVCPEFEFRVDDARTSDAYETYPYDSAVCLETLEHIDEDHDVLRRLRAGTRLVATVPDFDYPSHVRYFSSEDEVHARYAALFSDLEVTPMPLGKHTLFLLEGVTAG